MKWSEAKCVRVNFNGPTQLWHFFIILSPMLPRFRLFNMWGPSSFSMDSEYVWDRRAHTHKQLNAHLVALSKLLCLSLRRLKEKRKKIIGSIFYNIFKQDGNNKRQLVLITHIDGNRCDSNGSHVDARTHKRKCHFFGKGWASIFLMNRQSRRGSMKKGKHQFHAWSHYFKISFASLRAMEIIVFFISSARRVRFKLQIKAILFSFIVRAYKCVFRRFILSCFSTHFVFYCVFGEKRKKVAKTFACNEYIGWINSVGLACCEWQWHWKEDL